MIERMSFTCEQTVPPGVDRSPGLHAEPTICDGVTFPVPQIPLGYRIYIYNNNSQTEL